MKTILVAVAVAGAIMLTGKGRAESYRLCNNPPCPNVHTNSDGYCSPTCRFFATQDDERQPPRLGRGKA